MTDAPLSFVKFWVEEIDPYDDNSGVLAFNRFAKHELANRKRCGWI